MLPVMPGPDPNEPAPPPLTRGQKPARSVFLPRLSGKASAAWLVVCFLVTGALIPAVFNLALWVEVEIVVAAWWLIWVGVLTYLLYTGQRVTDDHAMGEPRNWLASNSKPGDPRPERSTGSRWLDGLGWFNFNWHADGEGLLGCLAIIFALVALFFLAWFLIELAIPLTLFVLYFITRGMLAQAINPRHRCKDRIGPAFLWALMWATIYTAPLAAVVWYVHYAIEQSR